jgi:hypothetical protein
VADPDLVLVSISIIIMPITMFLLRAAQFSRSPVFATDWSAATFYRLRGNGIERRH